MIAPTATSSPTPTIAVKVQCACGQRYAFDFEPVRATLPAPVACPICGVDGTAAANQIIAQRLSAVARTPPPAPVAAVRVIPAVAPSPTAPSIAAPPVPSPPARVIAVAAPAVMAVNSPAAKAPAPLPRLPGQMERAQAEKEARAKIMWGDSQKEVIQFLRTQGVPQDEAAALVNALFLERAANIRSTGMKKTVLGIVLICVPIASFATFKAVGYLPVKIFGLTVMVGAYGAWQVIKGVLMFLSPKSESGDAAEL